MAGTLRLGHLRRPRRPVVLRRLGVEDSASQGGAAASLYRRDEVALEAGERPPEREFLALDRSIWWTPPESSRWNLRDNVPALPQGAPTSPFLANLVCIDLDQEFVTMAAGCGLRYTRYADDLTFSGDQVPSDFVRRVAQSLIRHGFWIAREKTSRRSLHQRQYVTGVVINRELRPPRERLRRMRAILHRIDVLGPEVYFQANRQTESQVLGELAYLRMISPASVAVLERRSRWRRGV
jgi:retron-type reverse transcriptase